MLLNTKIMKQVLTGIAILLTTLHIFGAGQGTDTVCITGVGDIMLGTDYPSTTYLPPGDDCAPLLEDVKGILLDSDVTFGNLEGVFAGDQGKAKYCYDTTRCFVFRMPEKYVSCLSAAGFDLVSLANNHIRDFGKEGSDNSVRIMQEAGIPFAGLTTHPYTIITVNSVRYGLCAFAPNPGTVSLLDTPSAVKLVSEVSSKCDILIVSIHGGAEGEEYQHVTRETEKYLGNNRGNIYAFSHAMIDAGADIIFGHGPHVTRAVEVYKDRLIAYSLGNFCTYARFNLSGPRGYAPIIRVYTDTQGIFLYGRIIPTRQTGRGFTRLDSGCWVISKMQQLTAEDFPEARLKITDNGLILKDR